MLAKVFSGTTIGLEGILIEVEVDVANMGLPALTIVGLPDKAVDEAKDRVRTAIVNAGFEMPDSRITVNLAPADLPKEGSSFDLPIAIGILAASGMIGKDKLKSSLFVGELALEGRLRRVPGVISIAQVARDNNITNIFIPNENKEEAALVDKVTIFPIYNLTDVVLHLNEHKIIKPYRKTPIKYSSMKTQYDFDLAQIKGQEQAKRALEIAAAGFHNIHLKGPPGAGKTMLSRAFPSILPLISQEEILEITKIYSVSGMLQKDTFMTRRPFRAPHHTTSRGGLIGGGGSPKPGEISLAHRGVLFLDELPEFPRSVLESLRQPLEDGIVTVSRASGSLTFPARFLLIAASNPCPCGYFGHSKKPCSCMPGIILKYRKRLSGPLLDRIDLHVDVPPVEEEKLTLDSNTESSSDVRQRVSEAYKKQKIRFRTLSIKTNSQMGASDIKNLCDLSSEAITLLKQAIVRLSLSARSYFKIIKIAQTIADLENSNSIKSAHIAEALQYRVKED